MKEFSRRENRYFLILHSNRVVTRRSRKCARARLNFIIAEDINRPLQGGWEFEHEAGRQKSGA